MIIFTFSVHPTSFPPILFSQLAYNLDRESDFYLWFEDMIVFRLDTISALQYLLTEYLQLSSAQHMGRFYDNYLQYSEQMGRLGSLVVIFHQQHIGQTKQKQQQQKKKKEEEEEKKKKKKKKEKGLTRRWFGEPLWK